MRYLSVCSGIESASVAWSALAWSPVAFAEIESFPCAVLSHHYPHIPNLGDVNNFKRWPDATFDVLVGGTPCQSFSVAGLRSGLADPRGNLALVYLGIADRYQPRWLVWENVPGALSTNDGRDFSAIVGGMVGLGYGIAYRVLDAQHCRSRDFPRAVPQRRRRVVLVGHLGNWRRAAQVLFDAESLRGNPAPRRETGKRVAPTIASRTTAGGGLGTDFDCDGGLIEIPDIVSQAVSSKWFKGSSGPAGDEVVNLIPVAFQSRYARNDRGAPSEIAYPLTAEAGRTGKGDSAQLVMAVADPICANEQRTYTHEGANNFRLRNVVPSGLKVRRLTPRECERLQGFPDDYTLVPFRGEMAKDGPRYRAIGNAMATNMMQWLGERIAMVEGRP